MSNSEKLAFAILDHLSGILNSGTLTGDTAETLEVAVQCLEQVFKVESYDNEAKEALKVNKPLQEIFDAAVPKAPETTGGATTMQPTAESRGKAEELKTEGNQLMKNEKYQEAINSYTQAIELDNTNPVYPCNRAAAYSKIGDHKKAVEDCKRALKLDPKYSKGYGRMGLSYQSLGDFVNAKESYVKAIELEPDNAFYKNNLQLVEERLSQGQNSAGGSMGGAGAGAPGAAAAGAGPGGFPGGMPNLGGLDFASLLSNPAVMNMAQSFMQSPQMQQMVSSVMQGGAGPAAAGPGGGGNMSSLFNAAQMFGEQLQETNPDLMSDLRSQAQSAFNTNSDPEDPNVNKQNNPPEEKGDGSGKE